MCWKKFLVSSFLVPGSPVYTVTEDSTKTKLPPKRWSLPPASLPLAGGTSHSRNTPPNSAGSLRDQNSTAMEAILQLFRLGANYHRPMDLPDTTGLCWREGIYRCLGSFRSRVEASPLVSPLAPPSLSSSPLVPPSSPSSPRATSSSALPERRRESVLPERPWDAPRQRPPVAAPRKLSHASPLVPSSSPSFPLVPSSSALPERPRDAALPERPRDAAFPERPPVPAPRQRPPVSYTFLVPGSSVYTVTVVYNTSVKILSFWSLLRCVYTQTINIYPSTS